MLSECRALDLTDATGFLCGKILAELGADVIKVERPQGDPSRKIGPFWKDTPDAEKSLYWYAYNSNKRGITLNIEKRDGQEILKELIKTTDFIIESFPPGNMSDLGIGYTDLSKINKGLIFVSITPFGQTGPYRAYKASDIIILGMSGLLYLTGDSDRPPLQIGIPQTCLHGASDAAVGALMAYYFRERTGEGQHIDASMQQSTAWYLGNTIPFWELNETILRRSGAFRTGISKNANQKQMWKCKDGFLFFIMVGGKTGAKTCRSLVEWMDEEGMADEFLKKIDWENLISADMTSNFIEKVTKKIELFFISHTKKEILAGAVSRNRSICPLSGVNDLLKDPHLKERDFWTEIEHPELNTSITYPKEFAKSSEKSLAVRFRAPMIGEHNKQIYQEIGLSGDDLIILKQAGII
jgi:benzylsuccinate CoA-transferase BbsE subunit